MLDVRYIRYQTRAKFDLSQKGTCLYSVLSNIYIRLALIAYTMTFLKFIFNIWFHMVGENFGPAAAFKGVPLYYRREDDGRRHLTRP